MNLKPSHYIIGGITYFTLHFSLIFAATKATQNSKVNPHNYYPHIF